MTVFAYDRTGQCVWRGEIESMGKYLVAPGRGTRRFRLMHLFPGLAMYYEE